MRVSFAVPGINGLSGGLRVVAQYAYHLQKNGHQVSLLIRRPGGLPGRYDWLNRLLRRKKRFPELPGGQGHFEGLSIPAIHLDENYPIDIDAVPDADMIISTWWTTAEWADRLPESKGKHVHFIQGYEIFHPQVRARVDAVYRQKNTKIVVAPWLREKLAETYGVDSKVAFNGVDTSAFQVAPRQRQSKPTLGFMYSTNPVKNVALAISALERFHASCADIKAISFGRDARPQALPDWIEYEQQPTQSRIRDIYASCDLWLFTSLTEGFGLPILEAMSCYTPVLATHAGAAPDLIDGANGRLTDASPEAFGDAIQKFFSDNPVAWVKASYSARNTALHHDLSNAAQRFEQHLLALKEN